jgi:hypothetical protein
VLRQVKAFRPVPGRPPQTIDLREEEPAREVVPVG